MAVRAKICGINSFEALETAAQQGAAMIGLVFFPPSPRHVNLEFAAALASRTPRAVRKVGLFVDASDREIEQAMRSCDLDFLQFHGDEPPRRVAELAARYDKPVIKAIKLASSADLDLVADYEPVADWLLFDAKVASGPGALPGGNAASFDWGLLAERRFARPWLLSGGLTAENLAEAVAITGAEWVDVSSGVESSRGVKDPARIKRFLEACKAA